MWITTLMVKHPWAATCCIARHRIRHVAEYILTMGSAQSTPEPAMPSQPPPQKRCQQADAGLYTSLDEKFDAVRIDNHISGGSNVLDDDNREHVSVSKVEEYVKEVLKDDKNRLGLSTFTTANPISVLKKPSVLLRDTQYFNLQIPFEGAPVTNQRSSGRCWIFAACNVFRVTIQYKYAIKSFEVCLPGNETLQCLEQL